nr:hypothetical protein CFP56_72672 [Quercus suber]
MNVQVDQQPDLRYERHHHRPSDITFILPYRLVVASGAYIRIFKHPPRRQPGHLLRTTTKPTRTGSASGVGLS